jgi:glutathione S-transferase
MADFTIYIGNKNYSSWSLRAWLMLKQSGASFEEVLVPLREATTRTTILRYSPSGRLPALQRGEFVIWDSLAIGEYLAERFPEACLLPAEPEARAVARAVSAEMHAGFPALRNHLPMNLRSAFAGRGVTPEAQADINRVIALWRDYRKRFGGEGKFLFGPAGIADAMYAPVVSRFRTYGIALEDEAQRYADAVWALPALQEWATAAGHEPMVIEEFEF